MATTQNAHKNSKRNRQLKTLRFYLYRRALIGERTAEEHRHDVHQRVRHVMLERDVGMFSIVCRVGDDGHVQEEGPLKELPHVVGRVDLFHLHLGVDVAVGQEVHVSVFHL